MSHDAPDSAREKRAIPTEPGERPADAPEASAASAGLGRVMEVRDQASKREDAAASPASPGSAPPARPRAARQPPCPACGYDLTGTQDAGLETCPECGLKLEASVLQHMREQNFFRRFGWTVVLSGLVLLGTVAVISTFAGQRALFIVPLILILFAWAPFVLIARMTRDIE
ncbi:MAG: hypothetical protein AB8G96_09090 [Phycisphaerales bacterium]